MSACATRGPRTPARATPADLETTIARYVEVQAALAADNFDDTKTALHDRLTVADATTSPLVRSAADAANIGTMRARFKPLSEYLATQNLSSGYAGAYCPMYDGGSSWVQADAPVRNPVLRLGDAHLRSRRHRARGAHGPLTKTRGHGLHAT